jgi:hypothetical protein
MRWSNWKMPQLEFGKSSQWGGQIEGKWQVEEKNNSQSLVLIIIEVAKVKSASAWIWDGQMTSWRER